MSEMKVLVVGSAGQLGQALSEESKDFPDMHFLFLTRNDLDITLEESVKNTLEELKPDYVINTAAYTAVDAAEDNKETAYSINAEAVKILARYCKDLNIALIHISTDYVFNGKQQKAYLPSDLTDPNTVYGASKLAGENYILEQDLAVYAIIRTSWVYSKFGKNFVKTMMRLGETHKQLTVVNDQYGSPTYANDLARSILQIIPKLEKKNSGVYHYSNLGKITWYAFAKAIFEYEHVDIDVKPVESTAFPTRAKRPKYSVLDTEKISQTFGITIPKWKTSLQALLLNIDNAR